MDFFGLATLQGNGWVASNGFFALNLSGEIVLGSRSFGIVGGFDIGVKLFKNANQDYVFNVRASAYVSARVFGISLVGVRISFEIRRRRPGQGRPDRRVRRRDRPLLLHRHQARELLHRHDHAAEVDLPGRQRRRRARVQRRRAAAEHGRGPDGPRATSARTSRPSRSRSSTSAAPRATRRSRSRRSAASRSSRASRRSRRAAAATTTTSWSPRACSPTSTSTARPAIDALIHEGSGGGTIYGGADDDYIETASTRRA